ncbi:hypothetical protein BCR44DRAFT_42589, partial [Catenaria anguillulae PL171]
EPASGFHPPASTFPAQLQVNNAYLLLPTELLYSVAALARPRSLIPATARVIHTVCTTGRNIAIAWRNSLLLWDGVPRQQHVASSAGDQDPDLDLLSENILNTNNLVPALMSLLASQSLDGFAPTNPESPDPVFTMWYLRWLTARLKAPFFSNEAFKPPKVVDMTTALFRLQFLAMKDWQHSQPHSVHSWWRPIANAFLLPFYCIRSGRLGLLQDSLGYLNATKQLCHELEGPSAIALMSLPYALAICALTQWSLPAIKFLLLRFGLRPAPITRHAPAGSPTQQLLFKLLDSPPDDPARIIKLYNWMGAHGAPMTSSFPIIQHIKSPTPPGYIATLILEIDLPHIARVARTSTPEAVDACLQRLTRAIVYCLERQFDQELLDFVVQCDRMGQDNWAHLLVSVKQGASGTEFWWKQIRALVDDKVMRQAIATQALRYAGTESAPAQASLLMRILQAEFGVNPLVKMVHDLDSIDCFAAIQLISTLHSTTPFEPYHYLPDLVSNLTSSDSPSHPTTAVGAAAGLNLVSSLYRACTARPMHCHTATESPSSISAAAFDSWLDSLSIFPLAILTLAIFTTALDALDSTASRNARFLQCLPLDYHKAAISQIISRVHTQLGNNNDAGPVSVFNQLPSLLCTHATHLIRDLMRINPSAAITDSNLYKQLMVGVVQVDPLATAAAVYASKMWGTSNRSAVAAMATMIPNKYRVCARISRNILLMVKNGKQDQVV